jgi:hypothetical protein
VKRLLLFVACLFAAIAGVPGVASADPDSVTAQASSTKVEVGEPFTIELRASSEQRESSPDLKAPKNFQVSGPSISQQTMFQMSNGRTTLKIGMNATWQLVARAPGHFVIPAPSIEIGGKRMRAKSIAIDVVPATGKPRAQQSSPFLMPGGPSLSFPFGFGFPNDTNNPNDDDENDTPNNDLNMDVAPDADVFLRTVLDKKEAVIGEQVTASFYVYSRTACEALEQHEAPLTDFVRMPLLKNPGAEPTVTAKVGGRRFAVQLIDRVALFPMRAGALHTGVMSRRYTGRKIGARVLRESNDAMVNVNEPPTAGRPAGYSIGDVGQYTLSASIQPRTIEQSQALSVMIKISGTGNVPEAVRIPARTGIEWLDPEKKAAIDAVGTNVSGWRTLGYVVRILDSGPIDLGRVELPYWDPVAKRYQTAVATLGTIDVRPSMAVLPPGGSKASGAPAPSSDPFAALPSARRELGAFRASRSPLLEGAPFWCLLGAPPLLVVMSALGSRAVRSARSRRASEKTSARALADAALTEAATATAKQDSKALATAAERAVHFAIEAATGLKSRGVLIADLPRELEGRGVDGDLATRVRAALSSCDALRFDPMASAAAMAELGAEARAIVRELGDAKARA